MKDNNATSERRELKVLGIDLAKQSFQLHGVDEHGHFVLKKKAGYMEAIFFLSRTNFPCNTG
ncbi:MAG: hypothetical protein PHF31_08750 [Methylobacter sp.]|nr:hypothetical protein [Methylobacter sp.]